MKELLSLRDAYGNTLVDLGKTDPNLIVLDADLSFSTRTHFFKEKFPDRFFDLGLSEADMIGTAAGLAASGKTVFASTFAVFATGRTWDQIRLSVAYQELPVKIVATHAGVATGPDGYSHQAIEDMALMRALPGMRVIVPCDAIQTRAVIKSIATQEGPCYVRLVKQALPKLYDEFEFVPGASTTLRKGKHVTIGAVGAMIPRALGACEILESEGIEARVIDFASVKPIDAEAIRKACDETAGIVTCEDHTVLGGLGDAVAQVILSYHPVPHLRVGIEDRFSESGDPEDLYEKHGLTSLKIVEKVNQVLRI